MTSISGASAIRFDKPIALAAIKSPVSAQETARLNASKNAELKATSTTVAAKDIHNSQVVRSEEATKAARDKEDSVKIAQSTEALTTKEDQHGGAASAKDTKQAVGSTVNIVA